MKAFSSEVRMAAISLYARGLSGDDVSQKLKEDLNICVSCPTILKWAKEAGIGRTIAESHAVSDRWHQYMQRFNSHPKVRENLARLSATQKGSMHPRWKGDDITYGQQHRRAKQDYPYLLSQICELCGERQAEARMRIDHTYFPYHRELVVLSCHRCNVFHSENRISITFQNPHDGLFYCMIRHITKAVLV